MEPKQEQYWRKKLHACMHDSPGKVMEIWDHALRAMELARPDGFEEYECFSHEADWNASASDRLPWPKGLRQDFNGVSNYFRHPFAPSEAPYKFDVSIKSAEEAEQGGHLTRPTLIEDDPRAEFFARWRFWRWWASDFDPRLAFMPAETRLPDHTIWSHLWVTSAFQGCCGQHSEKVHPATLLFQVGPVQKFIAEARNTRDLWSGSYLLSYLTGKAMLPIIRELGPDQFLFPNLSGQPIIDLLMKQEFWGPFSSSKEGNLWKCFGYDNPKGKRRLLTPNLPNRFLCLLPQDRATELAKAAEDAFKAALAEVAEDVKDGLSQGRGTQDVQMLFTDEKRRKRFYAQCEQMLSCKWQVTTWPESVQGVIDKVGSEMPDFANDLEGVSSLRTIEEMAKSIHKDRWDGRVMDQEHDRLKTLGVAHAEMFHYTGWLLAGLKQTGYFDAWNREVSGWETGVELEKDQLNGREEVILNVPNSEQQAIELSKALSGGNDAEKHLLNANERLGASTLIKRFWHRHHLMKRYDGLFESRDFAMGNTYSISQSEPFDRDMLESEIPEGQAYYAVLVLDGDEIGKWLSGAKAPKLSHLVSPNAKDFFEKETDFPLKEKSRPISPSYHLQFSEALSTFANQCAGRIVEAFDGRLIYAGGDDVLALLPAAKALPCAEALRAAFRGDQEALNALTGCWSQKEGYNYTHNKEYQIFDCKKEGYLRLHGREENLEEDPVYHDCILPGPGMEVSAGIAIGHAKDPLQRLVEAARQAEQLAKNHHGRAAVAIEVLKRSGEAVKWGSQWDAGGVKILNRMVEALKEERLTNRYPYKVIQLLAPYVDLNVEESQEKPMDAGLEVQLPQLLQLEFAGALERHLKDRDEKEKWLKWFSDYVEKLLGKNLSGTSIIRNLIGLHQVAAWISKHKPDEKKNKKDNETIATTAA